VRTKHVWRPPERRLPKGLRKRLDLLVLPLKWHDCRGRRRNSLAAGQVDRGLHNRCLGHVLVCHGEASHLGRALGVLPDFRNARGCKDALVANGTKTVKSASGQLSLSVNKIANITCWNKHNRQANVLLTIVLFIKACARLFGMLTSCTQRLVLGLIDRCLGLCCLRSGQ
jgi:hypothetical protein